MTHTTQSPPEITPDVEYVLVAPELVEKLSAEWSVPVQVKIDRRDGNQLVLLFRAPISSGETINVPRATLIRLVDAGQHQPAYQTAHDCLEAMRDWLSQSTPTSRPELEGK